ncbi:MAG: IS5 family transposase [Candidatus Accumulibacter sp.]|jgi:IS5 family transposase|nr:IS5 family transposase [Accumulibacter sp.]
MRQQDFFAVEDQLRKIHELNSFLARLGEFVDFEAFRSELSVLRGEAAKGKGGRPPFDLVLMFKVCVLKFLYNLSDEHTELYIRDRLSFRDFLGLTLSDRVPDAKTIWLFGEQMRLHGLERKLFERFKGELGRQGFVAQGGHIVDGSFVEVPKQRNTREENEQIKEGKVPESFEGKPHVKAQKDCDARWTKKNRALYYGYKNHVKTDVKHKLIRDYAVTPASVHDSKEFVGFFPDRPEEEKEKVRQARERNEALPPEDQVFADSAYVHHAEVLRARGYDPKLCEKGVRNKPLTEEQKANNREKSRIRCRVEHLFGAMKSRARDEIMRCIGMARARYQIGMRNLVYNLSRYVYLMGTR